MEAMCEQWFRDWLETDLDSRSLMGDCSIAEQQLALLVRVLSRDARLLILDEPTTALAPPEVANLFRVIRRLRSKGITFVFVSHLLDGVEDCIAGTDRPDLSALPGQQIARDRHRAPHMLLRWLNHVIWALPEPIASCRRKHSAKRGYPIGRTPQNHVGEGRSPARKGLLSGLEFRPLG
jgi:hypothetical protein